MGNVFVNQPQDQQEITDQQLSSLIDDDILNEDINLNDEDYKKIERLFEGTYGQIWIVKKPLEKNYYLMNEIKKYEYDETHFKDILEESNRLLLLESHENIVKYIDSYQEMNKFILIIDNYGNGLTLRDQIEFQLNTKIHNSGDKIYFSMNNLWTWTSQISNGLKYLHSNKIYHRDLRVENVFIESNMCRLGNLHLEAYKKSKEYYEKIDLIGFGTILYELYELEKPLKSPFGTIDTSTIKFTNINSSIDFEELIINILNDTFKSINEIIWNDSFLRYSIRTPQPSAIPTIDIKKNFYASLMDTHNYIKVNLNTRKTLYNQISSINNYKTNIILTMYKDLNEPDYSIIYTDMSQHDSLSKIVILSEYGDVLNEFNGTSSLNLFNFKINDLTIDEIKQEIYISTDTHQIFKLKLRNNLTKLIEIGCIDTRKITTGCPKCLKYHTDHLIFNDDHLNLLIKLKINENLSEFNVLWKKPIQSPNRRIYLNNKPTTTPSLKSICLCLKSNEILCLFNNNSTLIVFDLNNGLFKRDNLKIINELPLIQSICLDSNDYLYSINDFKLFNINLINFTFYNSIDLINHHQSNKTSNKSIFNSSIIHMKLLPNGKLALIQDSNQSFNFDSYLIIIRPLLMLNKTKFLFY